MSALGSDSSLIVGCGVIAAVSIPLILRAVPPNRWYGFRTTKTLSNDELWFRANHFAGWAFLAAAAATASILLLAPGLASGYGALFLTVSVGIALFVTLAYVNHSSQ